MALTQLEDQITRAVETLSESVVGVSSTKLARDFRFGVIPVEGMGSGVIINGGGYVVTNNHVIDGATKVQVDLKDGRTFMGEVVGGDAATDIAVIRVGADKLPSAGLGDSEKLKVGQIVLAIGNALGLPGGPTVSAGVVSALARPLPGASFIFEGFIQTDAAINPGNSGGPLADLSGDVIGINAAIVPFAQGVGFAIPINTVKRIAEQILEKGRVVRPWLGVSGADLNPAFVRRYGLEVDSGVFVAEVSRDGPAHEAGIRVGDILVQIGPYRIGTMKDLLAALSKLRLGEDAEISIVRTGGRYRTSIRVEEAPARAITRVWR